MNTITITAEQIGSVQFDKSVFNTVVKQITTVPVIDIKTGDVSTTKLEYGIKFEIAGSTLKHALNMATLNSKTDIGNNLRARCKKDVEQLNNDTLDFFNSMLDDNKVLVVSGFPTALPDVPETPEQRKRTAVALFESMTPNEQTEYLKTIGGK